MERCVHTLSLQPCHAHASSPWFLSINILRLSLLLISSFCAFLLPARWNVCWNASTGPGIDLHELQKTLDAQGIEVVENQKENVLSRKGLAERTKGALHFVFIYLNTGP